MSLGSIIKAESLSDWTWESEQVLESEIWKHYQFCSHVDKYGTTIFEYGLRKNNKNPKSSDRYGFCGSLQGLGGNNFKFISMPEFCNSNDDNRNFCSKLIAVVTLDIEKQKLESLKLQNESAAKQGEAAEKQAEADGTQKLLEAEILNEITDLILLFEMQDLILEKWTGQ